MQFPPQCCLCKLKHVYLQNSPIDFTKRTWVFRDLYKTPYTGPGGGSGAIAKKSGIKAKNKAREELRTDCTEKYGWLNLCLWGPQNNTRKQKKKKNHLTAQVASMVHGTEGDNLSMLALSFRQRVSMMGKGSGKIEADWKILSVRGKRRKKEKKEQLSGNSGECPCIYINMVPYK